MCLYLYCVPDHIRTRAFTRQHKSASSLSGAINIHIFMCACGAPSTIGHSYLNATVGSTRMAFRAGNVTRPERDSAKQDTYDSEGERVG